LEENGEIILVLFKKEGIVLQEQGGRQISIPEKLRLCRLEK
jgi:hypothetical protein